MSKSILNAHAGAAALILTFAAPQALAADAGQLYYPPGPPAIDSNVYSPAPIVTGDLSITGGWWWDNEDDDGGILAGAGRVNVPLQGGPWNLTGEIAGLGYFWDGESYRELLGAVHLHHKTDRFAHGVYGTAIGYGWTGTETFYATGLGVEGAAFLGDTTLVGRLGHYWDDGDTYWTAEGIVRHYLTPNTKLAGIVAWASPGEWMLAAGAEHLFDSVPFSGFARAAYFGESGGYNWWELTVGARLFFHRLGGTLQQHDWDIPFAEATVANF